MVSQLFNKKCIVEYDGTNFFGWQTQKDLRTVQGEIENALAKIYKKKVFIIGSGRTDTKVHALGQVFSFRAEKYINNTSLKLGLNSLLSKDISILDCADVDIDFHAQRSAKSKTYLYKILCRETRSALLKDRAWWFRNRIDENRLWGYLKHFVGTHDFSSMCTKKSVKKSNIRTVNFINLFTEDEFIDIEINANGFLHNMVRNIVGTAIFLYKKDESPDKVLEILNSKDRVNAGPTAPPQGLYLKQVFY
jgi:tRNA pseudouridine38-40 synthase